MLVFDVKWIQSMSAQPKHILERTHNIQDINSTNSKKVNLNDLLFRLKEDKKKDKKNNIILSAAALSAVAVFGIILTL